ncbi:MAG: DUF2007 domain-containing protein [Proteobacteria bacterium]|nr:DUF2007 domain-containing protein [Pseudomonadota bacterium]
MPELYAILIIMITVYRANSSFDVKLIQDLLFHNDIDSNIIGEYLQGGVGMLQADGLVKLMVAEEDLDQSLIIIEKWEKTEVSEINDTQPAMPVKKYRPILSFGIIIVILVFYFFAEY